MGNRVESGYVEYAIRHEDWRDVPRIAELHAEAFDYSAGMGEVALTDALRRRRLHAPRLSLVAKSEGRVAGHAMFSLYEARIGGARVRASILAPVAVAKEFRGQGVASALIEEGHRVLEEMGVKVGLVLGHPGYYPRFGYVTGMFGTCRLKVARAAIDAARLEERRVGRDDIPALQRMWELWHGDVDLALAVGDDLADWISPDRRFRSVVLERGGEMCGFVKYRNDRPQAPELVLAQDGGAMAELLGHLAALGVDADGRVAGPAGAAGSREPGPLYLPLHPGARAVRELLRMPYEAETNVWDAGMLRVFGEGTAEEAAVYMKEVKEGIRLPGLVIWPSAFDVCS
ncbi:GNAT family N-acetyltransferase [Paenibacillus thermotolerans]|uniref:GNAT family N-acetyltransferase n=1 Tax=Paenibacillus thermotolerans TaxID=3027807 RepID=UPI0023687B4F|nr:MULTISPECIES: N-acetyltransferase [unclassified Paenibacillus]